MYNQIDSNKRRTAILIIIFIALISLIGYLIGYVTDYGNSAIIIALIISIVMALFGYYSGDKMALWSSGATFIKKENNPYLYRMVENLCITAGTPIPNIYLISSPAINAFATGRNPKNSSIAVTSGALDKLENEELEGVIAHELSHVKNYDILLMTILVVLVGTISILSNWFWRINIFGGKDDNNDRSGLGVILMVMGIILIILSPIIASLIQLAISRKREYLADASGALLTRYPEGLARALEKIKNDSNTLNTANAGTAHLYISNPFKGGKNFIANAFSTHPPIEDRIAKLRQMS